MIRIATRREKVILELQDDFTTEMARAAAATALLDRNLNSLSGSAVSTSRDSDRVRTSIKGVGDETDRTSDKVRRGAGDINQFSGRLRLLTEAALTLGPALVPIGAVGIPAVMGLAAGLGAAAGAAGVALLAFNGVGDAMKALDTYQLEPTTANLEALNEQMAALGPAGAQMVRFLDDLEPEIRSLQESARAGLFPGVEAGLTSLLSLMPQVRLVIFNISTAMGGLAESAGDALSGDGFRGFFDYLETDAGPLLAAFGATIGNITQGLASLMVAFGPLTGGFAAGVERMTASFADWAAGVSQTDGFRDFVSYVRESGPQVIALLGAMATAFIDIAQAAAPVADAVVPMLTALARTFSLIAASPIGPPLFTAAVALMAVNRAAVLTNATMLKLSGTSAAAARSIAMIGAGLSFATILAGLWAVDAAMDKVFGDDAVDSTNLTRNLTAFGNGKVSEDLQQLGADLENVNRSASEFTNTIFGKLPGETTWSAAKGNIDEIDQALASMVESGNAETAAAAMKEIIAAGAESGVSAAEVTKWFEQYNTALSNIPPSADEAAAAMQRKTAADNVQVRVARLARQEITGLVGAMREQTSAALGAFDAVTQYAQALMDARKQAEKSNEGINLNRELTRKQRVEIIENRNALSRLAASYNQQSDAMKNNVGKWSEARDEFIKVAEAMGVGSDRAKKLAKDYLDIPRSVITKIEARTDPAFAAIQRIKRELASIPREVRTAYYVTQMNRINKGPAPLPGDYASGGYTGPGGKYEPAGIVHRGEVVLPQEVVKRDWSMLASRYGNLPGFAGGGMVGFAAQSQGIGNALSFSADAAADSLFNLARLNEKELRQRQRLAEKELLAAEERADEMRDQLKAMRDARREFERAVASSFRSDVFGNQDLAAAGTSGMFGADFGNSVYAFAQQQGLEGAYNMGDWVQQYLDTLAADQIAQLQAQAASGTLQQDAQDAAAFEEVLRKLRRRGLRGGAYSELAQSGDLAQAQAYLQMGPEFLKSLTQDFQQRNQALRSLGQSAGEHLGADIREQLQVARRAERTAGEARDHLRSIDKRLAQLEKNGPERVGTAQGKALNNAVGHGMGKP